MEIESSISKSKDISQVPPQVRDYQDYRKFLNDWFLFKKSLRRGFSYRQFSSFLGLKSPNYLQLVIQGERKLSEELASKFTKLAKLSEGDRLYFCALVRLAHAPNEQVAKEAEKQMLVARKKMATTYLDKAKAQILSSWYHMLVRESVSLKDFEPSGEYISKKLSGLISPEQAEASLQLLLMTGLLKKDLNGKLRATDQVLDTGDGVFSYQMMHQAHGETLNQWGRNLAKLNPKEQELGLIHIPISSQKLPELRKRMRQFQDEIIGWLEFETESDRLVQLGTYLIPFD